MALYIEIPLPTALTDLRRCEMPFLESLKSQADAWGLSASVLVGAPSAFAMGFFNTPLGARLLTAAVVGLLFVLSVIHLVSRLTDTSSRPGIGFVPPDQSSKTSSLPKVISRVIAVILSPALACALFLVTVVYHNV